MDCTLALAAFTAAADAAGLGTCPISYVRNHIEKITPLLGLPPGVYPVAGLTVGWPEFRRPASMRLPPTVVVHRERYDDSRLADEIGAYDCRRRDREPLAPGSLKNNDVYGPKEGATWSENSARQLSVPERSASPLIFARAGSTLPDDAALLAPPRPATVRARHAASLVVLRAGPEPEMLMGMRGARHRFMPNRLVFPGRRGRSS